MPRGDRTGPWGQGPRTGRGLGYCSGYATPGYTKGPGMGWGRGYGGGRGWRGGGGRGWGYGYRPYFPPAETVPPYPITPVGPWPATLSPDDESKYLEQTLEGLKKEMSLIEKRLGELSKKKQE
ncbi:MAG: DUF5320 domain-containing protein [Candidatus Hodarchaeales archaeon]